MMIRLRVLAPTVALVGAALPSIAQPATDLGPASLTRLSGPEVRALFSRNLIIRQGAPQYWQYSDEFTARGAYFQSGRRLPLMGSYVIRDDLVCVDEGQRAAEVCRALYRSPNGDLWWTMNFEGTQTLLGIMRIQIERNPDTLKGM